jgi:hypothetical protein
LKLGGKDHKASLSCLPIEVPRSEETTEVFVFRYLNIAPLQASHIMLGEEGIRLDALQRVRGQLRLISQPEKGVRNLNGSLDSALLQDGSDPQVFPVAYLDHSLDAICNCDNYGWLDLGLFRFLKLLLKQDK